jgi:uncharacterized repeat protein (TIGR03803 family)
LVRPLLLAAVGLLLASQATGQTFTTLHSFSAPSTFGSGTNVDGDRPLGLALSGNTLYGVAQGGGLWGNGTIFALNTDGTGFRVLHTFPVVAYDSDPNSSGYRASTNSDGAHPTSALVSSGSTLYGGARTGGSGGQGTLFALNIDGTGFQVLYNFSGFDGAGPNSLVLSSDALYGTTSGGGPDWDLNSGIYGHGTMFGVNTDGTGFNVLYSFSGGDGSDPSSLTSQGGTLYGITTYGGAGCDLGSGVGCGTVFAINIDGSAARTVFDFSGSGQGIAYGTVVSGSSLYGATGASQGTLFTVSSDGTGFTTLHYLTNHDGSIPEAGLSLQGNRLYGTAIQGGGTGAGTVFSLDTDGTGFKVLHSFSPTTGSGANAEGRNPSMVPIVSSNILYGATGYGGSADNGTIFSISFSPQLAINRSSANIVLTWQTNFAGFDYTGYTLQSATDLTPPAVWSTNFPPPVVVNGQNTATNPISGAQQFYRLAQ